MTIMKQFLIACFMLTTFAAAWAQTPAPKGHMIYCCYADKRNDGWGRNFCELINENGKTTVVVYEYNHEMPKPDERHYEVSADVARQLETIIRENKFYEINGYKAIESMMGGSTKRVYMEFDSGEHINAEWFTSNPNKLAVSAYQAIFNFFQPWVEIAEKERMEGKSQGEESVDVDTDSDEFEQVTTSRSSKKYYSKKRKSYSGKSSNSSSKKSSKKTSKKSSKKSKRK